MPVPGREADRPILGCVRPGHCVARKCGELGGVTLTLLVSASVKQHPRLTSVSAVNHRVPSGKYILFSLDSNLILGTLCSLKKASFIASTCANEVSECLRNPILANTGVFVFLILADMVSEKSIRHCGFRSHIWMSHEVGHFFTPAFPFVAGWRVTLFSSVFVQLSRWAAGSLLFC